MTLALKDVDEQHISNAVGLDAPPRTATLVIETSLSKVIEPSVCALRCTNVQKQRIRLM